VAFNGIVGSFTDGNINAPVGDFTATIAWGDGSVTTGTVASKGGGLFTVNGSKTYAGQKTYNITVTVNDVGGASTQIASQATVGAAPVYINGAALNLFEGVPFSGAVATISTPNTFATASNFLAMIDWGDHTSSPAQVITGPNGQIEVLGSHTFRQGQPLIVVTVTGSNGAVSQGVATATVNDAQLLIAPGNPVSATQMVPTGYVLLAWIHDYDPLGTAGVYRSAVYWGDGSGVPGIIVPSGPNFAVYGAPHTYAQPGDYPVTVYVRDAVPDPLGFLATTTLSSNVQVLIEPVTGRVNPLSDSGVSNSDAITNVTDPNLIGTAKPNSVVHVFVQSTTQPVAVPVGVTMTDPNGNWNLTLPTLADGGYTVSAMSIDQNGLVSGPLAPITPLVIATTGPRVLGSSFNPATGLATVVLQAAGGLSPNAINASTISLAPNGGGILPLMAAVTSQAVPGGPITVAARFATGGFGARGGGDFILTLQSAGVTDVAGNPLYETVFTPFPQLGGHPGNYVAEFVGSSGPFQVVPRQAAVAAAGFTSVLGNRIRFRLPGR
jgi:hypothetical protein